MSQHVQPLPKYMGLRWAAFVVALAIVAWMCAPSSRKLAKRLLVAGEARQAAILLENALSVERDTYAASEIYEELASVEILLGNPKKALEHQEKSVEMAPNSIKGLARLAEYYDLFCEPEKAMGALTRAMELYRSWADNNRPEILDLTRGLEVLGPGDLPSLTVLKERFQEWFSAHRRKLAWYQRWFQQLEPAIKTHRELVRDYPKDFDALANLARLESYAGHGEEAQKALEKMKELRPNQKDIRDLLAYRYQWNRRPEKVVEEMSAAKLGREETRRRVLTSFVQSGRGEEGLSKYYDRYPNDKDYRGLPLLLAEIMEEEGDLPAARAVLEKLHADLPDDDEVAERLADVQSKVRDFPASADTYLALAARHPEDEKYTRWAIDALDAIADPKRALIQLEKLYQKHPDDMSLTRELGIRYVQLQRFADGERELETFVKANPEDQTALYNLALALGETGKSERAVQIYDTLIKLRGAAPPPAPKARPDAVYPEPAPGIPAGPVSRKVLALYKKSEGEAPDKNRVHMWAEIVLNHLGLAVEYRAAEDPLPDEAEMATYRGIITWFHNDRMPNAEQFVRWLAEQPYKGRPLVALERFGCTADERDGKPVPAGSMERLYRAMGIRFAGGSTENPIQIEVVNVDAPVAEFERKVAYETDYFVELQSVNEANAVHLKLKRKDRENSFCDAVISGPGGAFVLATYAMHEDPERFQRQWRVNPFALFEKAFRLNGLPRVDFTTKNGLRMMYTHIDGDGSDGLCRWDPPKTCAEAFHEHVLAKRPRPMTVSFIGSLVDPALHVGDAAIDAARRILAHPMVEPAHHTYSHPLDWTSDKVVLRVFGYTKVDLKREVVAPKKVLETSICPPDKKVDICLWSGSCNPPRQALALADEAKLLNLNGGDPRLDGNNPSISNLAPLHRNVGGLTQYLTSGPNDFLLTERWTLPSAAFRNVIQTFHNTGTPRRLTPVNLYFHFYLMSELGGTNALDEVCDWVDKQALHPVTVKDYIRITQGFRSARIALEGEGRWVVENAGACRTVRFDGERAGVDLSQSLGVLGFERAGGALYVHLDASEKAVIQLGPNPPGRPYLASATCAVAAWMALEGMPTRFQAEGLGPQKVRIGGFPPGGEVAATITVTGGAKQARAKVGEDGVAELSFEVPGTAVVEINPDLERRQ
jgi:tetratricopeptide (TPR) repeat protein